MSVYKFGLPLICVIFIIQGCQNSNKTGNGGDIPEATDERYAEHVRSTEFQTPEEERLDFILPPGFEVTLFASEPDITKPINMAFDEKGRLWVTQSSEYPIATGSSEGTDRITILEDTDGDGRADMIKDFANDLNIPIGIMPIKDGVIAYSIPNLYKFTDSDNDGKADKREVLLGEFEHKDTHGMVNNLFRGFDGWIHASHGFSNISVVAGDDGDSVKMVSGNTFRVKMDGSRVEKTTDGRINPFGSDYDEMGYHYSADCHTLPIFQLIWGGNYSQWGKREPIMGFAPTMMDYGLNSTALSGLVYYTDTHFPEEYRNSFYSGDVVTCRISRNTMEFNGTTPTAKREDDFLISRDPWFRPVDIKIGPDGAMYIADFYNRIIGHYEVPLDHPGRDRVSGRIWKITYKGEQRKVTDWSMADMAGLIKGMGHEVLNLRMRATDELVDRLGYEAVPSLQELVTDKSIGPEQLIQVLWALFRLDALAPGALQNAMDHEDVRVKVHALRILAEHRELEEGQLDMVLAALENRAPHVQRAAAELLSRHPGPQSYRPLIELHNEIPDHDTHLKYTILLGVRNHLLEEKVIEKMFSEEWGREEASLVALVISDVPSAYSGEFLLQHIRKYPQPEERLLAFVTSIARSLPESEMSSLVDFVKKETSKDADLQYKIAMATDQGMEQRGGRPNALLQKWHIELAMELLAGNPENASGWTDQVNARQKYAAEVAGKYKVRVLEPHLQKLLSTDQAGGEARATAAAALMDISPEKNAELVAGALNNVEEPIELRQRFAGALGRSETPEALRLLREGLKSSPTEVQESIAVILANRPEGKTRLMGLIRDGHAPARLLKSRAVEEPLLKDISTSQKEEYESLTANIEPISEERQQLIEKRLADFNPENKTMEMGNAVFIKHCSMCHQIDNEGGLIGPQLDGIGNWGRSSLTTKILDPNRNITENFRSYNITLKNGQRVTGLYRREEGQSLVLANQLGEEFTIAKEDVEGQVPSKYTLMPDNFHTAMSEENFDALMVYLLSRK
ncbi:MAG: PVC-type heme-binding CxxCH protein [Fulvivirga sp.]